MRVYQNLYNKLKLALSGVGVLVRRSSMSNVEGDPSITSGDDLPTSAEPNGSVYLRTNGRIYKRAADAWVELASATTSTESFRRVSSFPATIASDDVVLEVTASGTLALPTATAGRKLVLINDASLTLTHSAVERSQGGFSTSVSLVAGEGVVLRGNGSQWRRSAG